MRLPDEAWPGEVDPANLYLQALAAFAGSGRSRGPIIMRRV
jgi:hypothetical protein